MLASYHNHSKWSDGELSIIDFIGYAKKRGVKEFGFSDHVFFHSQKEAPDWTLPFDRIDEYIKEVHSFRDDEDISVLLGMEVDWFNDQSGHIAENIQRLPLDYIIGSVHFVGDMSVDSRPEDWQRLTRHEIDRLYREYWRETLGMVESRLFHIAGHLDLPKKFGFYPSVDLTSMVHEILDVIARTGMVLELNTSGWYKHCRECYPSSPILMDAFRRDIPIMLGADAHRPDHLFRDFDRAAGLLRKIGYSEIAQIDRGRIKMVPLTEAMNLPSLPST